MVDVVQFRQRSLQLLVELKAQVGKSIISCYGTLTVNRSCYADLYIGGHITRCFLSVSLSVTGLRASGNLPVSYVLTG